jgi:hypothetical protein
VDPDIKNLLEENLKLSKENNELLIKIRSVQRWSQISRIFYWLIIIGVSFGAFYFIQPYIGNLLNVYTGGVSDIGTIKNIGNGLNLNNIQDMVKELNQ